MKNIALAVLLLSGVILFFLYYFEYLDKSFFGVSRYITIGLLVIYLFIAFLYNSKVKKNS